MPTQPEEGSPEEEAKEPVAEAQAEGDTSPVSDELQSRMSEILTDATMPELNYIIAEATDLKKKMMRSQEKGKLSTSTFSTEDMPK